MPLALVLPPLDSVSEPHAHTPHPLPCSCCDKNALAMKGPLLTQGAPKAVQKGLPEILSEGNPKGMLKLPQRMFTRVQ